MTNESRAYSCDLYLLCFDSAPTNILSMVVFIKQGLKERINLCLFFQSLADLLFMTMNVLMYIERIYMMASGASTSKKGPIFQFVFNNYLLGFYGFYWASGFMTMVIACERCFCVLSPLRSQIVLQTKSTLIILLVAFFLIVGGFFVIGTRWNVICVFNPRTSSSSLEMYPSEFYLLHKELIDTLDTYVYGVLIQGTFVLVLVVTTVIIIVKLRKMASWRETSSSAATTVRDVALTRMLIGCSILFIACNIPGLVFWVLIVFVPDFSLRGRYYNTFTFITNARRLFSYINSSFNFFIYYAIGSKFKATLHALCGRRGKARASGGHTVDRTAVTSIA